MLLSQIYNELKSLDFNELIIEKNLDAIRDSYEVLKLVIRINTNSERLAKFLKQSYGYFSIVKDETAIEFVVWEGGPYFSSVYIYTPWVSHLIYKTSSGYISIFQENGNKKTRYVYIGNKPDVKLPLDQIRIIEENGLDEGLYFVVDFLITVIIANLNKEHLLFHAATLHYENKGIIIAGDSMRGKTTLSLGLTSQGLGFLSDEVGCIDLKEFMLWPFPKCLYVREKSKEILKPLWDLEKNNTLIVSDNNEKRWMYSGADLAHKVKKGYKAKYFFFLKDFKNKPECLPAQSREVLWYLLSSAFCQIDNPPQMLFNLCPILDGMRCFNLWPGELLETIEYLKEKILKEND